MLHKLIFPQMHIVFMIFVLTFSFFLIEIRLKSFQMYESYGSTVYMSMSADATCRGLRTSRDGPLVLKFTKGKAQWNFCIYAT